MMLVTDIDRDEQVHCGLPTGTYPICCVVVANRLSSSTRICRYSNRRNIHFHDSHQARDNGDTSRLYGHGYSNTYPTRFVLRQDESAPLVRTDAEINEQFDWTDRVYASIGYALSMPNIRRPQRKRRLSARRGRLYMSSMRMCSIQASWVWEKIRT